MSVVPLQSMLATAAPSPAARDWLLQLLPFGATTVVVLLLLFGLQWVLFTRRPGLTTSERLPRQLGMLAATVFGLVAIALSLPIEESTQGQIMAFLGVLLTAIIGLSSTTLVANAMAGLMLRSVQSFHPGDFVQVGEHFGRVTERGLFHTEIQTEDRDLTTLPNVFLIQNPIKVVRTSGTIVSATVSLGYDLDHDRIEKLLAKAAESAGLEESYTQVMELGDFSVTYRIAGFLKEVKQVLSVRSRLRKAMLDTLHGDGVEIVSPNFMNQRPLDPMAKVIPPESMQRRRSPAPVLEETLPEEIIFDKAEVAERRSLLELEGSELHKRVDEVKKSIAAESSERAELDGELASLQQRLETIAAEQAELEGAEGKNEPRGGEESGGTQASKPPSGAHGR